MLYYQSIFSIVNITLQIKGKEISVNLYLLPNLKLALKNNFDIFLLLLFNLSHDIGLSLLVHRPFRRRSGSQAVLSVKERDRGRERESQGARELGRKGEREKGRKGEREKGREGGKELSDEKLSRISLTPHDVNDRNTNERDN